jgi:hypothetical protein
MRITLKLTGRRVFARIRRETLPPLTLNLLFCGLWSCIVITILNTSILTNYGRYDYCPLTLEQAKEKLADGFVSAIGHQSTADLLTTLLDVSVPLIGASRVARAVSAALCTRLTGIAKSATKAR